MAGLLGDCAVGGVTCSGDGCCEGGEGGVGLCVKRVVRRLTSTRRARSSWSRGSGAGGVLVAGGLVPLGVFSLSAHVG